ncbi:olfactory receptor 13D1-like [Rhinatrema bivittatum]|uniref:olfactory receptor 13D1-like n=1 Tax=Rhinatrema bivittatum TaxID=194408 RepID=UPI00112D0BF8|nr:olfactory receptor 13D1-like [Rhinatrema bivittatum]
MTAKDLQRENQSQVTEFLILGFSEYPKLKSFLFVVFLSIYLITLFGNLTLLIVMCIDSRLHKPMYFFLSNLAILDICLTSCTLPKMLTIFIIDNKVISFQACMTQLYLLMSFTSVEFFLLGVMAFDRYVAICNPLHYSIIMNKRVRILLSACSWSLGFLDALPHSVFISNFSFCGHNIINHLFCDFYTMLKLSCSDTSTIKLLALTLNLCLALVDILLILTSYAQIISAILKIQSVEGRSKAFSTCSSHLMVVGIYSGTAIFVYLRPHTKNTTAVFKLFDALHNTLIPMMNPIIYSLRNKDVKAALMKVTQGRLEG